MLKIISSSLLMRQFSHKMMMTKLNVNFVRQYSASQSGGDKKSWKVLGLNHVAIATNGVEKASYIYSHVLNMQTSPPQALPEHGVNTVFINANNTKLELLDPIGESKSPIWSFLEKNKSGGIHHICLEVDDVHAAMHDLKSKGIRILSESPRIGAHGKPVIFLHPKDCNGVLIELEQV